MGRRVCVWYEYVSVAFTSDEEASALVQVASRSWRLNYHDWPPGPSKLETSPQRCILVAVAGNIPVERVKTFSKTKPKILYI